jgi:Uma2 family endonuclease
MGVPLAQPRFDIPAFIAWEAEQPQKHECIAGEVFAMMGARQAHVVVSLALAARFREHLRGARCRAYTSDFEARSATAR